MQRSTIARRTALAVSLLALTLTTACWKVQPSGELVVQRTNAATTHALVFVDPGEASPTAPNASVAPHVRIRNVGEPGSLLRVTVHVPAGMSASVASRELSAGESVNVTLAAVGASRDAVVRVSGGGDEVLVPVRVVSDIDPVCDATGASVAAQPLPAGARIAEAAGHADGFEALVRYDAAVVRAAALPLAARRALTDRALAASGARLLRPGGLTEHDLVWVRDDAALEALRRTPGVSHAVPNVPVHRLALPDDPRITDQWWALRFGAVQGWSVTTGSDTTPGADRVVVAILDDSLNTDHVDLRTTLVPGCDVFDFDDDVRFNAVDHGSHVAGIAAATGDNGAGIAGIAYGPQVRVLPVKLFPDDAIGSGTLDSVTRALLWSAGHDLYGLATNAHPADVINMSFGFGTNPGSFVTAFLQALVDDLSDGDGPTAPVLVAAAGNTGVSTGVEYPARLDGVIAVGSVDHSYARSAFSNHGLGLDLVAAGGFGPAGDVCSGNGLLSLAGRTDTLACLAGTSMATPVVTGTVALLLLHDPTLRNDPSAVRDRLVATAHRPPGWNVSEYGAGVVCLDAVLGAGSTCATFP